MLLSSKAADSTAYFLTDMLSCIAREVSHLALKTLQNLTGMNRFKIGKTSEEDKKQYSKLFLDIGDQIKLTSNILEVIKVVQKHSRLLCKLNLY
jgi:hypothetical protein